MNTFPSGGWWEPGSVWLYSLPFQYKRRLNSNSGRMVPWGMSPPSLGLLAFQIKSLFLALTTRLSIIGLSCSQQYELRLSKRGGPGWRCWNSPNPATASRSDQLKGEWPGSAARMQGQSHWGFWWVTGAGQDEPGSVDSQLQRQCAKDWTLMSQQIQIGNPNLPYGGIWRRGLWGVIRIRWGC